MSEQIPAQPPVPPSYRAASNPAASGVVGAGQVSGPAGPLTSMRWSVTAAVVITVLTMALTVVAGLFGGLLGELGRVIGVSDDAAAALMGGILSLSYVLILVVVWGVARSQGRGLSGAVGLNPVPLGVTLAFGLAVAVAARFISGVYGIVLDALGVDLPGAEMDPTQLLPESAIGMAFTVLLAVVLAPVVEEIVFRGVLMSALGERWGMTVGIVTSSIVFALVHVLPFSIPPIFALALVLGWMFVRSRSLWPSVAAHAIFNGLGIAALYALKGFGLL